jgi:hypothetical protein
VTYLDQLSSLNLETDLEVHGMSSLKTPAGFFFVCLGTDTNTGDKTLCFFDRQAFIITVPRSWAVPFESTALEDAAFMSFVVVGTLRCQPRCISSALQTHN